MAIGVAFAIIILMMILFDLQEKMARVFPEMLNELQAGVGKLLGMVIVKHIVKWHSWTWTKKQVFKKGVTEQEIRHYNITFARQIIQKHNLQLEPDVEWDWEVV